MTTVTLKTASKATHAIVNIVPGCPARIIGYAHTEDAAVTRVRRERVRRTGITGLCDTDAVVSGRIVGGKVTVEVPW